LQLCSIIFLFISFFGEANAATEVVKKAEEEIIKMQFVTIIALVISLSGATSAAIIAIRKIFEDKIKDILATSLAQTTQATELIGDEKNKININNKLYQTIKCIYLIWSNLLSIPILWFLFLSIYFSIYFICLQDPALNISKDICGRFKCFLLITIIIDAISLLLSLILYGIIFVLSQIIKGNLESLQKIIQKSTPPNKPPLQITNS
jgi:hypothetical protein